MHYYQFNIGDYHSHTSHLDPLEDVAYRRMIDYCYLNEIPLPPTVEEIARLIRMRTHTECIAVVLGEFFTLIDDGYIQPRIDADLVKYHEKSNKAKKSAEARWNKKPSNSKDSGDANALRPECEGNANHKPLTNNHKPITKEIKTLDESAINREFEKIWIAYGKKGNKKTSKAKFSKLSESKKNLLLNHIPNYVFSTPDKQFRKNLETYINQECWNDEVTQNAENKPNQTTEGYRLSAVERVRATNEANRASRANNRTDMANRNGHLRERPSEPVRADNAGCVGNTLEGNYTETD